MTALDSHRLAPWPEVRPILWARCQGRCELCSLPLQADAWDAHHRQLRSGGGPSCPCNGLALHPRCHTLGRTAVHHAVAMALQTGHNVSRYDLPQEVPVIVPPVVTGMGPGAVLLGCGGTYL